jgi:hypothetical protein
MQVPDVNTREGWVLFLFFSETHIEFARTPKRPTKSKQRASNAIGLMRAAGGCFCLFVGENVALMRTDYVTQAVETMGNQSEG